MNYDGKNLYIKYLDKPIFKIFTNSFKKCQLGKLLGKVTNEFKVKIGTNFKDNKRDLTIIDREYRPRKTKTGTKNDKWYKYHCNICRWGEGWIAESALLRGNRCLCCDNKIVVEHINSIVAKPETQWMIPYFQGGYDEAKLYTKRSGQKIFPTCPDCRRVKDKSISIANIYNNHSIGCSCSDGQSYPFKLMFNMLEQLNIKFETEYSPEWIKPRRYDFYFKLNNKKYIIEADGRFHSKDNSLSGQTKEESKFIDDKKDRLADEHGIKIIRIDCEESDLEYIKNNVLNSELNGLFDLSIIDWIKCEEFALSNRVLEACKLKKENPDMTTTQIGGIMNLSRTTIKTYLGKGSKIWN